jgi:hypothetical protein
VPRGRALWALPSSSRRALLKEICALKALQLFFQLAFQIQHLQLQLSLFLSILITELFVAVVVGSRSSALCKQVVWHSFCARNE